MARSVLIAAAEPGSGKSLVTLGLVNTLLRKAKKIGYFKPIINADPKDKKDTHIQTVIGHFGIPVRYEDTFAFTRQEALQFIENESQGEMIDAIIGKYKLLEENFDFTVMEGSDFSGEGIAIEFELNLLIAKNLCCPAILVVSGECKSVGQIVNESLNFLHNFKDHDVH